MGKTQEELQKSIDEHGRDYHIDFKNPAAVAASLGRIYDDNIGAIKELISNAIIAGEGNADYLLIRIRQGDLIRRPADNKVPMLDPVTREPEIYDCKGKRISLKPREDEYRMQIILQDNGIGIPRETKELTGDFHEDLGRVVMGLEYLSKTAGSYLREMTEDYKHNQGVGGKGNGIYSFLNFCLSQRITTRFIDDPYWSQLQMTYGDSSMKPRFLSEKDNARFDKKGRHGTLISLNNFFNDGGLTIDKLQTFIQRYYRNLFVRSGRDVTVELKLENPRNEKLKKDILVDSRKITRDDLEYRRENIIAIDPIEFNINGETERLELFWNPVMRQRGSERVSLAYKEVHPIFDIVQYKDFLRGTDFERSELFGFATCQILGLNTKRTGTHEEVGDLEKEYWTVFKEVVIPRVERELKKAVFKKGGGPGPLPKKGKEKSERALRKGVVKAREQLSNLKDALKVEQGAGSVLPSEATPDLETILEKIDVVCDDLLGGTEPFEFSYRSNPKMMNGELCVRWKKRGKKTNKFLIDKKHMLYPKEEEFEGTQYQYERHARSAEISAILGVILDEEEYTSLPPKIKKAVRQILTTNLITSCMSTS